MDVRMGNQEIFMMKFEEPFVVHSAGKRRIRPSNWIDRLMCIVAAHYQGRVDSQPCGTCCQCPDTTCFVFPASLPKTRPGLAQDLLFCLRILEVPDLSGRCPRNVEEPEIDRQSAA
jgi:hypothetical protein